MKTTRTFLFGLAMVALGALNTTGCGKGTPDKPGKGKEEPPAKHADGWLFHEPNENYHIRLLIDASAKKATAKVFDGSAKELQPVTAEIITLNIKGAKEQIVLKGEGEKGKKRTVFIGIHDRFADKIDPKRLEMAAEIDGKNYTFELDDAHGD